MLPCEIGAKNKCRACFAGLMKTDDSINLSFIIPTYNEEENIGKLLEVLKPQMLAGDEVVVVDSFSKDRTAKIAKSRGAKVFLQPKLGIGPAKTEGARRSRNKIVVMLDADSKPSPRFADIIRMHFQDKKLVAVAGLDLYISKRKLWQKAYNIFSRAVFYYYRTIYLLTGKYWLPANNSAIRKDVFLSVGGYHRVVCEDSNLMKRLPPSRNVKYDSNLIVTLSSRRFEEKGFLNTVLFWMVSDLRVQLGLEEDSKNYRTG